MLSTSATIQQEKTSKKSQCIEYKVFFKILPGEQQFSLFPCYTEDVLSLFKAALSKEKHYSLKGNSDFFLPKNELRPSIVSHLWILSQKYVKSDK